MNLETVCPSWVLSFKSSLCFWNLVVDLCCQSFCVSNPLFAIELLLQPLVLGFFKLHFAYQSWNNLSKLGLEF
jgi:hypothetical protein